MIAVVGAGASGLAAAIFAARRGARGPIVVLDGARRPGAKILVSGGSRCNVTNAVVTESDFSGSPPHLVRRVLRAFPAERTVAFFRELGVALHEEEHGKLFPDENSSRVVLRALLDELARRGIALHAGTRVTSVEPVDGGFRLGTSGGPVQATRVVLATGGRSLPRSGSDGLGLELVQRLGHSLVPLTPALVPLVLEGDWHTRLAGVAQEVELRVRASGRVVARRRGPLLWTHFGVSGPAVLDVSREFLRARLEGQAPSLEASLLPGCAFEQVEQQLIALAAESPRLSLVRGLARRLPAAVAEAVVVEAGLPADVATGRLGREERRRLVHALVDRVLHVRDSRGWDHAEVTAGGVPLAEVDTRTMESRRCARLHVVGEMLDVDGRLGGFNFQWAWASGWVAGGGLAAGESAGDHGDAASARS